MKYIRIVTAALFLGLAATTADQAAAFQIPLSNVYYWKVFMPADLPFESCTVRMSAGGNVKDVVLQRGQTYIWTAPYDTPLIDIRGWRYDANRNKLYLVGRTCAGTDYQQGFNAVECKHNVSVRICAKPAVPPDPVLESMKYGFCPD